MSHTFHEKYLGSRFGPRCSTAEIAKPTSWGTVSTVCQKKCHICSATGEYVKMLCDQTLLKCTSYLLTDNELEVLSLKQSQWRSKTWERFLIAFFYELPYDYAFDVFFTHLRKSFEIYTFKELWKYGSKQLFPWLKAVTILREINEDLEIHRATPDPH